MLSLCEGSCWEWQDKYKVHTDWRECCWHLHKGSSKLKAKVYLVCWDAGTVGVKEEGNVSLKRNLSKLHPITPHKYYCLITHLTSELAHWFSTCYDIACVMHTHKGTTCLTWGGVCWICKFTLFSPSLYNFILIVLIFDCAHLTTFISQSFTFNFILFYFVHTATDYFLVT